MTSNIRIDKTLNFETPDRLPVLEWAPFWTQTVDRWRNEGLPESAKSQYDITDFFGLDRFHWIGITAEGPDMPPHPGHGLGYIKNESDYQSIKKFLYPDVDLELLETYAQKQQGGDGVQFNMVGFFWWPRVLFGIEPHMYAFYDHEKLMRQINEDLLEFHYKAIDQMLKVMKPQFVTLNEDMSYNHGQMLSKSIFNKQLGDCYQKSIAYMHSKGLKVFIDSDGLVDEPVDWYRALGYDGFLPLEKQAGVDLIKFRQKHPKMLFLGGFDKMCMSKGEDAMRLEFERLLPVMKQGGYILGVDHQTPPEVSVDNYRIYIKLLKKYANKAVE